MRRVRQYPQFRSSRPDTVSSRLLLLLRLACWSSHNLFGFLDQCRSFVRSFPADSQSLPDQSFSVSHRIWTQCTCLEAPPFEFLRRTGVTSLMLASFQPCTYLSAYANGHAMEHSVSEVLDIMSAMLSSSYRKRSSRSDFCRETAAGLDLCHVDAFDCKVYFCDSHHEID